MKIEQMPKRERDNLALSKLKLVNDFNANMGGVDRDDAPIGNYISTHLSLMNSFLFRIFHHFCFTYSFLCLF